MRPCLSVHFGRSRPLFSHFAPFPETLCPSFFLRTQPFKNESEIVAMTGLVEAYQQKDARAFETILQNNKKSIMDDPFIRDYIEGVCWRVAM